VRKAVPNNKHRRKLRSYIHSVKTIRKTNRPWQRHWRV